MPNHVRNRIIIHGTPERVEEIVGRLGTLHPAQLRKASDTELVCFQKEEPYGCGVFNIRTGKFTQKQNNKSKKSQTGLPEGWELQLDEQWLCFPDFEKVVPPPEGLYDENSGLDWYSWNVENWGVKWNSYDHFQESWNSYIFHTAWDGVIEIIKKISQEFPDVIFDYMYSCEFCGQDSGEMAVKNGEEIYTNFPDPDSKESFEIHFKLWPDSRDQYKLIAGEYVEIEGEDI